MNDPKLGQWLTDKMDREFAESRDAQAVVEQVEEALRWLSLAVEPERYFAYREAINEWKSAHFRAEVRAIESPCAVSNTRIDVGILVLSRFKRDLQWQCNELGIVYDLKDYGGLLEHQLLLTACAKDRTTLQRLSNWLETWVHQHIHD